MIFQQFGPEALDARRLLFEEAEKKGDLKFDDAGVRRLFYYYANMRHGVIDAKALERPWFSRRGALTRPLSRRLGFSLTSLEIPSG